VHGASALSDPVGHSSPTPIGDQIAVHYLAQATPAVYYVAEIDVSDPEAYTKEYVPKAEATIKAGGGRYVATGGAGSSGKVTGFDGDPQKNRVVIHVWDNLEKIQAWHNSSEYQEARKIGDKHAKFCSFAVDGLSQ
jgi:uncharacterized protein (DUF1330 family)